MEKYNIEVDNNSNLDNEMKKKIIGMKFTYLNRISIKIIPLFAEAKSSIPQENESINDLMKKRRISKNVRS